MKSLTVVLTNYNRPKIILPVIDSVIKQPLKSIDLDVLIIDDGSVDIIDEKDLVKYNGKVKLHRLPQNKGLHAARNVGISIARGEFVLVADDDDTFIENSLQGAIDLILSLEEYEKYPVFQFAGSNGYIPCFYMLINESHYYNGFLKGDFTPIINKRVFEKNGFSYPEYEEIKKISCENLLWADIGYKFGIPTWMHNIILLGETATNRLTNPTNWILKANQFARLQRLTIQFMEKNNFDKKYPEYYNLKFLALYAYLLLDNKALEAREVIRYKYKTSLLKRSMYLILSVLPSVVISKILYIYRCKK